MLSLIAMGCNEMPEQEPQKAVIEGIFCSGGYPSVYFTSSVSPGIDGKLSDAVINWGKVTISDGEREVVLSGRVDNTGLPPFRYYTFDMVGEPGKTYKITADFKNLHAVSQVRMPCPTPIDSITIKKTDNDSTRAATLHFTSPADTPAYYYLSMRLQERNSRSAPCMLGSICTDVPNNHYSIPVLKPIVKIDGEKYEAQLEIGEEWEVSLNRVEKEVYEFWKAYDNMVLFSNSPFISSNESLPTNISGGFGVWSPQGTSTMQIKVE